MAIADTSPRVDFNYLHKAAADGASCSWLCSVSQSEKSLPEEEEAVFSASFLQGEGCYL